jgi:fumarate hydratase class I
MQAADEEFVGAVVGLFHRLATELPADIEQALEAAREVEAAGSPGRLALDAILEDIRIARRDRAPMCQDTGLPLFFLQVPRGMDLRRLRETVTAATRQAVAEVPLRSNAVDPLTGRNPGDGVGPGIPVLHFEPSPDDKLHVDLLMKGGQGPGVGLPAHHHRRGCRREPRRRHHAGQASTASPARRPLSQP